MHRPTIQIEYLTLRSNFLYDISFTWACISSVLCLRSNSSISVYFSFHHAAFRSLYILCLILFVYVVILFCSSGFLSVAFLKEFRCLSRIVVLLDLSLAEPSFPLAPYLFSITATYGLLRQDMSLRLLYYLFDEASRWF